MRSYWPVAQPADAESAWLRVSTPYSGDGKGQMFTPEVSSQVLVGYEHGLAEFPVALGGTVSSCSNLPLTSLGLPSPPRMEAARLVIVKLPPPAAQ